MTANVFEAPERPQCLKTRQLNRSNIMCRSRSNRLHCNETVWEKKEWNLPSLIFISLILSPFYFHSMAGASILSLALCISV